MSVEKLIGEQNKLSKKINKVINKINPGILIDTRKICPLLGKHCIGNDCLSFSPNFGINVVSWEESLKIKQKFLENVDNDKDWMGELFDDDWELNSVITIPRICSLDETTYIFSRKPEDNTFGRCISLGKK